MKTGQLSCMGYVQPQTVRDFLVLGIDLGVKQGRGFDLYFWFGMVYLGEAILPTKTTEAYNL